MDAAVTILMCICSADFLEQMRILKKRDNVGVLDTFLRASKECPIPYIPRKTDSLEKYFSMIMRYVASKDYQDVNGDMDKQVEAMITCMQFLKFIIIDKKTGSRLYLKDYSYEYATMDRMEAILIRMRKSLKRGTNGEIAIALLQGLAQMDGKAFNGTIKELKEQRREDLEKFVLAVYNDFHKPYIEKSIQNYDVKVQVHDDILDLSSINMDKVTDKKKYKMALTTTLENYAASPESAKETLATIKGVFLEYFMWEDAGVRKTYTKDNMLWKMPNRKGEYFDNKFVGNSEDIGVKEGADTQLAQLFAAKRINGNEVKKRINYVNCGEYQKLRANEQDEVRIYWINYAKKYVEKTM